MQVFLHYKISKQASLPQFFFYLGRLGNEIRRIPINQAPTYDE